MKICGSSLITCAARPLAQMSEISGDADSRAREISVKRSARRPRRRRARRRSGHRIHRHAVRAGGREAGGRQRDLFPEPDAGRRRSARRRGSSRRHGGRAAISFRWLDDFVGLTYQQQADAAFDADAVFVGHGIIAPEYQWDDYEGVDVRGKVVVLFTNEPPSDDPKFFTGRGAHLLRPLDL